jgi:hypothetical protein
VLFRSRIENTPSPPPNATVTTTVPVQPLSHLAGSKIRDRETRQQSRDVIRVKSKLVCASLTSTAWSENWSPISLTADKLVQFESIACVDYKVAISQIHVCAVFTPNGIVKEFAWQRPVSFEVCSRFGFEEEGNIMPRFKIWPFFR